MSIVSLPMRYLTVNVFPSYVFSMGTVPSIRSTHPEIISMVEMIEIDMRLVIFIINDIRSADKYN